eukprot:4913822-Amphidinium_carterae.1
MVSTEVWASPVLKGPCCRRRSLIVSPSVPVLPAAPGRSRFPRPHRSCNSTQMQVLVLHVLVFRSDS